MKFSENWLRELVAIDAPREALVERLTMAAPSGAVGCAPSAL